MTNHITVNAKQYPSPAGPHQSKTVYVDPNQYPNAAGPSRPTTMDRARQVAHDVGEVAADAYAAGARARKTLHDVGQNPYVQYNANRSGFTEPVSAVPRHPTSRAQYSGAPVHDTSVMHPGNRIIITRCNDETGQCKTIATGVEMPRRRAPAARRAPPGAVGGLGGNDPGFL